MRGGLPQCDCVLHISAVAQSSRPNGRELLQIHRSLRQQSAFGIIGIMTGSLLAAFDHYLIDPPKSKTLFRNVELRPRRGFADQLHFLRIEPRGDVRLDLDLRCTS
jgi:hypothetical protein